MAQGGSEAYSPRSFDWYPWTSVDHLITTSNHDLTYSRGFCSIIPVTTDPESQPRVSFTRIRKLHLRYQRTFTSPGPWPFKVP